MNVLDPVENLLVSVIAVAPSPAVSGTTFTVATGHGALFPDPATDGAYNLVIYPTGIATTRFNSTIVRVTGRTGDVFTVTRDVEGSNTREILEGDEVAMNITAKMMTDIDAALATIPTDVSELADSTGVIPTDVSNLTDSSDLIKEDVSELTDTTSLISGKISKAPNVTTIDDTGIADGEIAVFDLTNKAIETSNVTIATTVGADDSTVPTSAAVATLVNSKLFTWIGDWSSPTAFALYDAVQNKGSSYVCKSAHTSGASTEPGVGASWTTVWDLFVEGIGGNSLQTDCSGGTSDTYGALSGLVNSSNTVYTVSLGSYVSGSLRVYLNGQLQTQGSGEDWSETTPASGTFTFATAPTTGDIIIAVYQFTTGSTGNADTLDGLHGASYATITGTETLTNKTLTSPKLNEDVALTSTSAELNALDGQTGAWVSYTPTFANITLGNGSVDGDYIQIGKLVFFKAKVTLGSTSSITNSPTVSLPVTASSFYATFSGSIGTCDLVDTGVKDYIGGLRLNSTTVAGLLILGSSGLTTAISSTVPFTWATGDQLLAQGFYEAA